MSRRERLRAEPFEPERVAIIERNFPYFARLSQEDQRELLGHVRVFLDEKKFEGCVGLELTDEIKLTIAAQACLLLLHRETDYYPQLDVILVYPHAYRAKHVERAGGRAVLERDQARLGESHRRGLVVLSWDAVKEGAADERDGHNVVLHEFAHKLDEEDGAADGAPILEHRSSYGPWARVLGAEFEKLAEATRADRETDIDSYGATNPAEFFAVVTEQFFEQPEKLAKNHPHLYEQLSEFYMQDPLARLGVPFVPPKPEEAPRVEPAAPKPSIVVYRTDGDPTRHANELRTPLLALGAEPRGFIGTQHATWGFVSEVYGCPDATVCASTSHFPSYGDVLAFHTLFADGTIVATETAQKQTAAAKLSRVIPFNHPRERFFVVSRALPAEALYAEHVARVRRIGARVGSTPLDRDPVLVYAACRLRSTALLAQYARDRGKLQMPVAMVTFLVVATLVATRAEHLTRGAFALAIGAGAMVAILFSERVAAFIQRRRFRTAPVPADELLARASELENKHSE